jgi:predicted ferric reductase
MSTMGSEGAEKSHATHGGEFGNGVERGVRVDDVKVPLLVQGAKWFLWLASWSVSIWWISLWFRLPAAEGKRFKRHVSAAVASTFWGKYSTNYVLYVAPVIALALLALLYLELEERYPTRVKHTASERSRIVRLWRGIWTQPIFVKTPIGIITLIDIVVIVIVFVCTFWVYAELLKPQLLSVDKAKPKKGEPKWARKWEKACDMSGRVLPYLIAVLFIPVSRGSPILRLINLPFEQAIQYHRWIGYLTVVFAFMHGATYAVYAGGIHKLELLVEWPHHGTNNLAGVISVVAGVVMGLTSIPYVRNKHFNTFFTMHHLYFVFLAFYVFHVDWNHCGESMGPVLLFFIDRFLRMVQSRREVTGVHARVLPSGLIELKIPKQPGFKYNTLSFLYLNFPGLSKLQWHPFSTSSSPLHDDNEISIHIKPLGDWTTKLHNEISSKSTSNAKLSGCPFAVKLHAEGPYGHERDYFLRYRNLMLVAGGAGITPFMAIVQDILKRHSKNQEGLPTTVNLIWCVRSRGELATLNTIKPGELLGYDQSKQSNFRLNVHAYVTGEAKAELPMVDMSKTELIMSGYESPQKGDSKRRGISTINSFQNLWMIALILASMTGFVLMSALIYHYVTNPKFLAKGERYNTSVETILHFFSLFVGIVVCGGSVIFFWMASSYSGAQSEPENTKMADLEGNDESTLLDSTVITEGSRPKFQELFSEYAENHDGQEVGVLVCGPEGLQESVAEACRSRNFASFMKTPFHYHSVSFDL